MGNRVASRLDRLLELLRKLTLTGFVLLIPQQYRLLRVVLAILISVTHLVLLMTARPHKQRSTYAVAVAASILLTFTLLIALLVTMYSELPQDQVEDYFGFDSVMPLVGIILAFNFSVLLVTIVILSTEVRGTMRDTLRRRDGGQGCFTSGPLPALSLAEGKATHVFFSHCWPNQAMALAIKQMLETLMPGVQVFMGCALATARDRQHQTAQCSIACPPQNGARPCTL